MIHGDWGLGIGDWGLGIWELGGGPKTKTPIPQPQKQNPTTQKLIFVNLFLIL